MSRPLFADGIKLDDAAHWEIVDNANRWSVPGAKGSNVPTPGKHGALYVAGKTFAEGEFVLSIAVVGADVLDMQSNVNRLLRMFGKRHDLIHFQQDDADGNPVECYAEAGQPFDLVRNSAELPYAKFAVDLTIPAAFWQDGANRLFESSAGVQPSELLPMPEFADGTAPMDDLEFLVDGPADNPEIFVSATSGYVRYNGNLLSTEQWRVNSADWSSVKGTDIGFTGSGVSVIGATVHAGSAPFVNVPAYGTGTRPLALRGVNFGASTRLSVRGRRKFLTIS